MNTNLKNELEGLSPKLSEHKVKGDGFRHPDDYFNGLENRVFEKIEQAGLQHKPLAPTPSMTMVLRSNKTFLAAASIIGLCFFGWQVRQILMTKPAPEVAIQVEAPAQEVLEAYILENITEFEPGELVSTDDELPASPTDEISVDEVLDNLSDEELEDLL